MKKYNLRLIFFLTMLGLLGLSGCAGSESAASQSPPLTAEPNAPNAMPPAIMVNDILYRISENPEGRNLNIEVDKADYLGMVTSSIPLSEMPTENGQSNCVQAGTPYIEHGNGIGLFMAENWVLFKPEPQDE
ncbi:MAG: hypothetical protein FWH17_08760 [Oscillospiraceae bacterium]|nr:hypothetical protein [Oscillospiraceae bacterium]